MSRSPSYKERTYGRAGHLDGNRVRASSAHLYLVEIDLPEKPVQRLLVGPVPEKEGTKRARMRYITCTAWIRFIATRVNYVEELYTKWIYVTRCLLFSVQFNQTHQTVLPRYPPHSTKRTPRYQLHYMVDVNLVIFLQLNGSHCIIRNFCSVYTAPFTQRSQTHTYVE